MDNKKRTAVRFDKSVNWLIGESIYKKEERNLNSFLFLLVFVQLPGVDAVVPDAVEATSDGANGIHKRVR